MAQQSYRANLSAAIYPMALSRAGRSVIIPGIDQNYDRRVDPTGEQKTPGIPQALYLENVLPTVEGYQSVGFISQQALPGNLGRARKLEIRDVNIGLVTLFFCENTRVAYAWYNGSWRTVLVTGWPALSFFPYASGTYCYASVRGKTYVLTGSDLFEFQFNSPQFELVWKDDTAGTGAFLSPIGVLSGVVSIASSFGYLLILKRNPLTGYDVSVLWSSLLDESDFTPSLTTGAGGGTLATSEGTAVHMLGTPNGFRVYTGNIVEATYTGNSRYPFKLVPLNADAPPVSWEAIYGQNDMQEHLYFTEQRSINVVSPGGIQTIAPELSEFLERFLSEQDTFDYTTNMFSKLSSESALNYNVRLFAVGEKYIFVSVGNFSSTNSTNATYQYCYVFDRRLQRYGKLKISHTHIFEGVRSRTVVGTTRNDLSVYFVNTVTGVTQCWDLDKEVAVTHQGVLLLGRFQGVRSRRIALEEIELESGDCSLHILPSSNGKTFETAVTPYETADSTQDVKKYLAHVDSKNVCFLIKGAFDLSTVEMKFHLGGDS